MLENHSIGSAAGNVKHFVASGDGRVAAKRSKSISGPEHIGPGPQVTATEADRQPSGFWSVLVSSLMEGLAFYGASVHSIGFFPLEPVSDELLRAAPKDEAVSRRRRQIRVISSKEPEDAKSTKFDRGVNRLLSIGPKLASGSLGKREREIKKATDALAKLDDGTLLSLGIPHRSYIEQTVRFCHDC